jgi:hypothetical protein
MCLFNFQATAIGSLGHVDPKEASSFMLEVLKDIPCWPQLPQRSFKENMYVQFSENIPAITVDESQRRIFLDSGKIKDEDFTGVYEKYLAEDINSFALGREYAAGLYEFLAQSKPGNKTPHFLKGHITGPISFLLTVTDENKKPLIYHNQIADGILKILEMKARWQAKKLKEISQHVIIFVDEPYLVSIGSGYVTLDRQELLRYIDEVIAGLHKEGVLAGIHCCGNTDWEFLTQTQTDIINFDAYNFSESLSLYPEAVHKFLRSGGAIAWGIVPTTLNIEKVSPGELLEKLKEAIKVLTAKGIDKELICKHSLLTPSCGLGSFSPETGEKILQTTQMISEECRGVK